MNSIHLTITHNFNLMAETVTYSEVLKTATIITIYKTEEKYICKIIDQ